MNLRLLALLLAVSVTAVAADREFDDLVKSVESHYGIKRTPIPFMKLGLFATKIAHPGGVHGLKVAVFENLQSCERCFDIAELDGFIAKAADSVLHPLVRTHSHGEATYILTGEVGKTTKMLVGTFDQSGATIVEVTVDAKTLLQTISSPRRAKDWIGNDSQP
jgi:hypothetical protein